MITSIITVYVHDEKEADGIRISKVGTSIASHFHLSFGERVEIAFLTPLALHAFFATIQRQIQEPDREETANDETRMVSDEASQ